MSTFHCRYFFIGYLERLTSITKSTYLFVQQLISLKLLDLDNDEYEKVPHRYRTRVDADAAALELLCLSCDDEIGKIKHSHCSSPIPPMSKAPISCSYLLLDPLSQSKVSFRMYGGEVFHRSFFFFFFNHISGRAFLYSLLFSSLSRITYLNKNAIFQISDHFPPPFQCTLISHCNDRF